MSEAGTQFAFRLRGVGKKFGWNWAVRELDLELTRRSSLALIGPNGAGKTTLLKILAGLYRPSAGDGEVGGVSLSDDTDGVRRRTALLAESAYLYDELTALENLRFAALMSGTATGSGGRERREEILDRVGLGRFADSRVRTYSAGMRKRLSLARLRLHPGELVLLDEPYANLDRRGAGLVDRMVREMKAEGRSVVLASHQPGEATRTADRVALLRDGTAARVGTPEEAEEWSREFLGPRSADG